MFQKQLPQKLKTYDLHMSAETFSLKEYFSWNLFNNISESIEK